MIDYLPETDQTLLLEIVRRFIPDDVATESDRLDIAEARFDYRNGSTVSHDSINWN